MSKEKGRVHALIEGVKLDDTLEYLRLISIEASNKEILDSVVHQNQRQALLRKENARKEDKIGSLEDFGIGDAGIEKEL